MKLRQLVSAGALFFAFGFVHESTNVLYLPVRPFAVLAITTAPAVPMVLAVGIATTRVHCLNGWRAATLVVALALFSFGMFACGDSTLEIMLQRGAEHQYLPLWVVMVWTGLFAALRALGAAAHKKREV